MPPPATKRRKLEQSEDESEGSFADFGEFDVGSEAEESDGSEVGSQVEEEVIDDDDDAEESVAHKKPPTASTPAPKTAKRAAATLQDTAYTSESFKSNMFKLQVDELLEQVKPKYGRKEAPAENAMRTLKTILESLSSRDALPVRYPRRQTPCQPDRALLTRPDCRRGESAQGGLHRHPLPQPSPAKGGKVQARV